MDTPIRSRMYTGWQHKTIWLVAVVASAGLLAPPLFLIAAKRRVVAMAVPVAYAAIIYGTAVVETLLGNPKNWAGMVLAIMMFVSAVHAAILDADWKSVR